jgi:hypothetical protein
MLPIIGILNGPGGRFLSFFVVINRNFSVKREIIVMRV